MTIYARLELQGKWRRYEDGSPKFANILCGVTNRRRQQRCGGPLAYLVFPKLDDVNRVLPQLYFPGMRPDSEGVYRPTEAALKLYRETGVLGEELTKTAEAHLQRHPRQILQRRRGSWMHLLWGGLTPTPSGMPSLPPSTGRLERAGPSASQKRHAKLASSQSSRGTGC